ncbi:MAG: sigma-70 family RNA polymerase sigma factor [Blastocatellales bacterium]
MPLPRTTEITQLLVSFRAGDTAAAEKLMPIVYDELRRAARRCLKSERNNHTLQPTELVHETYLRLFTPEAEDETTEWKNRAHFFAIASLQMRRILVDHARAKKADKREGSRQRVELTEADGHSPLPGVDLIALDQALQKLEELHPRHAKIVEMRYFGGMKEKEAAEALEISVTTLKREWEFARAWLFKRLKSS